MHECQCPEHDCTVPVRCEGCQGSRVPHVCLACADHDEAEEQSERDPGPDYEPYDSGWVADFNRSQR